jgi:XisI protein
MQKAIEAIKAILIQTAQPAVVDGIEYQLVFDDERHHYQINAVGWTGKQRVHGILVQIDIKNDLIWIQEDNTEERIADQLVAQGIPKSQIVLAFHAPYKRPYTGFATGE